MLSQICYAQNHVKDTLVLSDVELMQVSNNKLFVLDSTLKSSMYGNTLDQQISVFVPIAIKNYGSGNFSTASYRGGNASQVGLLWNGISVSNLNSGNLDFSLFPISSFDQISFDPSSESNNNSFGYLEFKNSLKFDTYTQVFYSKHYQLHDILSNQIGFKKSNFRHSFSVTLHDRNGDNQFPIYDSENKQLTKQKNADLKQEVYQLNYGYKINPWQQIKVFYWDQNYKRTIPDFVNENHYSNQIDNFNRAMVYYDHVKNKHTFTVQLALLKDNLQYVDNEKNINSKIQSINWITKLNYQYFLTKKIDLKTTIDHQIQRGISTNYINFKNRNISTLRQSVDYKMTKFLDLSFYISPQCVDSKFNPIIYGFILNSQINKYLKVNYSFSKYVRNPVFNDLYWGTWGNPNLKSEQGLCHDFGLNHNYKLSSKMDILLNASLYSKSINDWIIWLPVSGGVWNAQNARKVWSRGFEGSGNIKMNVKNVKIQLLGYYSYNQSTYQSNNLNTKENVIGKQLIYVPIHQASITSILNYKYYSLIMTHQYQGWRFTSSDNVEFLPAYNLTSLTANIQFYNKDFNVLSADFQINNFFNTHSESVANVPMPLRTFKIGIQYKFK